MESVIYILLDHFRKSRLRISPWYPRSSGALVSAPLGLLMPPPPQFSVVVFAGAHLAVFLWPSFAEAVRSSCLMV